jgi:hypothetical protein
MKIVDQSEAKEGVKSNQIDIVFGNRRDAEKFGTRLKAWNGERTPPAGTTPFGNDKETRAPNF